MKIKRLLAALLAACMCFTLFACGKDDDDDDEGSSRKMGYEKAIENCMDVYFKGKFDKLENLAPEAYWDYWYSRGYIGPDELARDYYDFESMQERYEGEFGSRFSAKYKIKESEKISSDDLAEMREIMNEEYDIPKTTVKAGYIILIEFTYQGSYGKEINREEVYALQIDGNWYICDDDGDFKVMEYSFDRHDLSDLCR